VSTQNTKTVVVVPDIFTSIKVLTVNSHPKVNNKCLQIELMHLKSGVGAVLNFSDNPEKRSKA
jgi:hypothetical protein